MEPVVIANLISLWVVLLFLLLAILAVIRQLRAISQMLASQLSSESRPVQKLKAGAPAPDFTAFNQSGRLVTLSNYLGRSIAFIFISPHCEPCRNELPELVSLYPLVKKTGMDMMLVTMTTPADMEPLINEHKIPIPILYSPPQISSLADTYNPNHVYPFYCFVDDKGMVISTDMIGKGDWPVFVQKYKLQGEESGQLPKVERGQ